MTTTADPQPLELVTTEIRPQIVSLADEARAFTIRDSATLEAAGEFLRLRVKAMLRQADEAFDPIIKAAHATHKVAVERKKAVTEPLLEAERTLKGAIGEYHASILEQQRVEQRRLEAEARVEAERKQLEAAAALEKAGQREAAEQVLQAPVVVLPVPRPAAPPPAAPKGVSVRTVFKYRFLNPDLIHRNFMVPNEGAIAALVKSQGQKAVATIGVGGIEVYEESVVSSRSV